MATRATTHGHQHPAPASSSGDTTENPTPDSILRARYARDRERRTIIDGHSDRVIGQLDALVQEHGLRAVQAAFRLVVLLYET